MRRKEVKRVMSWKRRNFARAKLMIIERNDNTKQRHAAAATFLAGHTHQCISCPKKYSCTNACDPVGEGVKTSICPSCFEEASRV